MNYWRSVGFIFENEKWWLNFLVIPLCLLVPIIGPIVVMGYLALMIEKFHQSKDDKQYDVFDLDKLGDYVKRGIWPFLGAFVLGIIITPIILLVYFVGLGTCMAAAHNEAESLVPVIIVFLSLLVMVISLVISFLSVPVCVGCALGGDFKSGFSISFMISFLKNCWLQILVSFLFLYLLGFIISILAAILWAVTCGVGFILTYPLAALVMVSQWHLFWQLYELNLERGGVTVKLKED
jgi:MFS family permease